MLNKSKPSPVISQLLANAGIHAATNDNSWDYINKLSLDVRNHLFNITGIVNEANNFLESVGRLQGEASVLVNGLFTDIQQAATEWKRVNKTHMGRTGFGKSPQEHSEINEAGLSYIQLHETMTIRTAYAAPRLQELVIEAEQALAAMNASAQQDPQPTGSPVIAAGI